MTDIKLPKDATAWLEKVGRQLGHVCNGEVTKDPGGAYTCEMDNGVVVANVSPGDYTRMLHAKVDDKTVRMESDADEMVITRSLSGSIEFLHKSGASPEVRIEQKGKRLEAIKINAYNDKVKTSLYGHF